MLEPNFSYNTQAFTNYKNKVWNKLSFREAAIVRATLQLVTTEILNRKAELECKLPPKTGVSFDYVNPSRVSCLIGMVGLSIAKDYTDLCNIIHSLELTVAQLEENTSNIPVMEIPERGLIEVGEWV